MTDTGKNMQLWLSVCKTDTTKIPVKDVKGKGYKCTTVDAQSLLKWATEIFGPYGTGFGIKDVTYDYYGKQHATYGKKNPRKMIGPAEIVARGVFWYWLDENRTGEFDISSSMIWDPAGDCQKKLLTNMMSKALSKLGFNSDIYEKNFDDDVYSAGPVPTPAELAARAEAARAQAKAQAAAAVPNPAPAPVAQAPVAQPGTPLPPQQPPVAPPPPVQTPPQPHPQASLPPGGPPQSPDNGMDMLLVKTCKYEISKGESKRPQFAVEIHACDGAHRGKDFKSYFGLNIFNGDPKDEPFPHHCTRRFLASLNLDIKTVQQNPAAFCNRIAEQYFKAELEEGSYFNKHKQCDVTKLDINGAEMTSAYPAANEAAQVEQQTLPPPPGTPPPAAPPTPTPGMTGVPGVPGDVELDADIDLEEDEDYLTA